MKTPRNVSHPAVEAFRKFCATYPAIQITEIFVLILCLVPTTLLVITVQRAPFHVNCRYLVTLWTLTQLIEYLTVLLFNIRMMQYENNYAPKSFLFPPERHDFLCVQLSMATVACFLELGITLERAFSVRCPESYHNTGPARLTILNYLVCSTIFGSILGWMMGPETSASLISTIVLNCIDVFSFCSNIAVMVYCRRQYAKIYAKTSLNARYQVREANDVARALFPAYISGMIIKVLIAIFTWAFTFGIEKAGLYFLNEFVWITLQLLSNGLASALFLLKHDRLRGRLRTMVFPRFAHHPIVPFHTSAQSNQYFKMFDAHWK